jgi:hypothetical protein
MTFATRTQPAAVPGSRTVQRPLRASVDAAPVPWYTRHMRGAIEADRARRREHHVRSASPGAQLDQRHPRVEAALRSDLRRTADARAYRRQARADTDRWNDEGGRLPLAGVGNAR